MAVRQRLARLRRGPMGPKARDAASPSSRAAAAVPALPDATTVAFPLGTAAVPSFPLPPDVGDLAVPYLQAGPADLLSGTAGPGGGAWAEPPSAVPAAGSAWAAGGSSRAGAGRDVGGAPQAMPVVPMPRAAARRSQPAPHPAQPHPHRAAAARSRYDSASEAAVDDVPPPSGPGAHPWDLPPPRDLDGRALTGDPTGAAPLPDPTPGTSRLAAGWETPPDEPDVRPSRFGGASPFDPGRRGVKALAVVALVVVLIAAVIAWRARPKQQPVAAEAVAVAGTPTEPGGTTLDGGAAGPDGTAGSGNPVASGATGASPGEVVVAVAGKVRKPGLVRLPAGARVADALEAAGGALPGTDVALLNLARKVTDGELILVGVTAPPAQPAAPGGAGQPTQSGGMVNLNTATLAELDALPGVGPVLAQRILNHRDQHGGFRAVSDLRQVDGIGDARYEQLKELVTV